MAKGDCAFLHEERDNENQNLETLQRKMNQDLEVLEKKTEELEALFSNYRRRTKAHQRGTQTRVKLAKHIRKGAPHKQKAPGKKVKKNKIRYWEDRQGLKKAA